MSENFEFGRKEVREGTTELRILSHFSKAERAQMEDGYDRATEAVRLILAGEIDAAMNQYNKKQTTV